MTDKNDLVEELNKSTQRLLGHLSSFNETEFNFHPTPHQWSAAGIAEHLLIIESKTNEALNGTIWPTEREPGSKIELFRLALQDRSQIIDAPEKVRPSGEVKDRQKMLSALQDVRTKINKSIFSADLSATAWIFLTRDWVNLPVLNGYGLLFIIARGIFCSWKN
ncbi:MAG: hypothetical protein JWN76_881 [Chitinophagaceae bacterium]|nr:hypothetical protein [Chitinophagaceae bacterium]